MDNKYWEEHLKEHKAALLTNPLVLRLDIFTVEDEKKIEQMTCLDGPANKPWALENPNYCAHGEPIKECLLCDGNGLYDK